jgi:hypothetical protein
LPKYAYTRSLLLAAWSATRSIRAPAIPYVANSRVAAAMMRCLVSAAFRATM